MTTSPPLPVALSSLVGRESEAADLNALLRRPTVRLMTLTGPGGVGKTRLAIHVADQLHDVFPDGIWLVRLEAIREVDLVLATIAKTVGIADSSTDDLVAHLINWLGPGKHLFVIDNFEQVTEASPVLGKLLEGSPGLKIFVTSRTSLGIVGEHEFPLDPLPMPGAKSGKPEDLLAYPAVQLFVDRATEIRPSFQLTEANAADILAICRQLDGLPLAIELAAARTRILTPAALRERLANRLKVLTSGPQSLPARQQTMRDAIAWSYNLLTPDEQHLLRVLSVFSGGFTLESVEFVCRHMDGDVDIDQLLESLTNLVDHSLVRRLDGASEEPRFDLFQTIQEFAWEELESCNEVVPAQTAHAEYVIALIEEAEEELVGPDQVAWLNRLAQEHDNIRSSMTFAIGQGDAALAMRIPAHLWRFWWFRGHLTEGRRWFRQVFELHDGSVTSAYAYSLRGAGALTEDQGDHVECIRLYNEALAAARELGDRKLEAQVLGSLGTTAHDESRYDEALAFHTQAQVIYKEIGYRRGVAAALGNIATVSFYRNDLDAAQEKYEEALLILKDLGDLRSSAMILGNLGAVAYSRKDFEKARDIQEQAVAATREMGDEWGMANALTNLGNANGYLGDWDKAEAYNQQALEVVLRLNLPRHIAIVYNSLGSVAHELGNDQLAVERFAESARQFAAVRDLAGLASSIASLADLAQIFGDAETAARLFGFTEATRAAIGVDRDPDSFEDYQRIVEMIRTELGEQRFREVWTSGGDLTLETIGVEIEKVCTLARAAVEDPREAALQQATGLSRRQIQIVRLYAGGKTNAEIAGELGLADWAIVNQIGRIFTVLGVQSRAEVSAYAFKQGII